jgi:hypothetical protein
MFENLKNVICRIPDSAKAMNWKTILQKLISLLPVTLLFNPKNLLIIIITLFASASSGADDEKQIIFLNTKATDDAAISYSVMPGDNLFLPFTGTQNSIGTIFEFYLTSFHGEYGDNITVNPGIVELPGLKVKDRHISVLLDRPVLTLKLEIPELPTAGKYTGNLVVQSNNQVQQTITIVLTRATVQRPAQLSVDLKSILIHHTKPWLFIPGKTANFTMLIRNNNSDWKARGVFLRLLEITTPKGVNFNPGDNLTLKWNGKDANNLWRSPSSETGDSLARVIAPNEQAEISGEFLSLSPGDYNIKLGLGLLNGLPESEQQIILKVEVRDNATWAILILLLAIAISFVANKFLETQYSRSALLRRISEIRPPWLREEPNTLPVVSVRTLLKQAEDRNKNIWVALFSSTEVVADRINKAENILKILSRIRRIREQIKKWNVNKMIKYRAEKRLRKILAEMGWETIDENFIKELEIKLELLEKWFSPDQLYIHYWNDLKEDIENLLTQARPEVFGNNSHQNIITLLHKKIKEQIEALNSESTKNEEDKQKIIINLGYDYARLKILWESNINEDVDVENKLFDMFKSGEDKDWPVINDFWTKADDIVWENLKEACENKNNKAIEFTSPIINNIQPLQTFQLIQFDVATKPRSIGNNFLFKHGLEYHWSLYLNQQENGDALINPVTREPRLVQYVPEKGRLNIEVELCRNGIPSKKVKMDKTIIIEDSSDFGWRGIFRSAEITALVIATLFAVISGLASFYISNPVFGNTGDYIALFIWGAGVDQGKNFLQRLHQSAGGTRSLS